MGTRVMQFPLFLPFTSWELVPQNLMNKIFVLRWKTDLMKSFRRRHFVWEPKSPCKKEE